MIDNHVHLDLIEDNLDKVINRARKVNVDKFIVPGVCGFPKKLDLLLKHKEVKICWGIYPKYAQNDDFIEKEFNKFNKSSIDIVAIGECGLDKRYPCLDKQISLFKKQIEIAKAYNLPLIIHLVGYWQKAFEILKEAEAIFILHSWNGSVEMAKEFFNIGATFSLSASSLRNTKKLSDFFKIIPEDRIIFETDSPDQKPEFILANFNEPAYLPQIVEKIMSYQKKN